MLTVVWSEGNNWIDMSTVKTLVVDTYGWYFDVEVSFIFFPEKCIHSFSDSDVSRQKQLPGLRILPNASSQLWGCT